MPDKNCKLPLEPEEIIRLAVSAVRRYRRVVTEEDVQDVICALYTKADLYQEGKGKPSTFVYIVAGTELKRKRKKQHQYAELPDDEIFTFTEEDGEDVIAIGGCFADVVSRLDALAQRFVDGQVEIGPNEINDASILAREVIKWYESQCL